MNIDADGDGIPDLFDNTTRILLMEGSRILEALLARHRALAEAQAHELAEVRQWATTRLRAEATQSRYRLEPVMSDNWWARADLDTIGRRYAEAKSWDGVDPTFLPFVERIEERAKALHDLDPEHILDAVQAKDRLPLTLDEARAVAAENAPAWYRLHDRLTDDLDPNARLGIELDVIADMTRMRDTGRLDTDSAKNQWAQFSGFQYRKIGDGESPSEYAVARQEAVAEHWDRTLESRRGVSAPVNPDGVRPARPMSVPEARQFMEQFAPDWFQFGHDQNVNAAQVGDNMAADRAAVARLDDQMRYAMETLRDTGTMAHPYASAMRDVLSGNPEFDAGMGPQPIPYDARVAYGGSSHARPLTDAEALAVMTEYAPEWYRTPMQAALSPDSALTGPQRAGQLDAIRADMQQIRDRGTLASDHAMRVWAVQQPESQTTDAIWGEPLRPNDVWARTVERREGPAPVPESAREELGGIPVRPVPVGPSQPRSGPYDGPITGDGPTVAERKKRDRTPEGPAWDSSARRMAHEERLRGQGHTESSIKAWRLSDTMSAKPGGFVDPKASQQKPAKGARQSFARRNKRGM